MTAVIDESETLIFQRQGDALCRAAAELENAGMCKRAVSLYTEAADQFQIGGFQDLEDGARELAEQVSTKA